MKDFFDWLYGCKIYHGTTRYGQFNGHHVFATNYGEDDSLRDLLDDLEAGDIEALDAAQKLNDLVNKEEIWMTYNDDPRIAMKELIDKIEYFYFNVLNKNENNV
jgi:hypothetical protein